MTFILVVFIFTRKKIFLLFVTRRALLKAEKGIDILNLCIFIIIKNIFADVGH